MTSVELSSKLMPPWRSLLAVSCGPYVGSVLFGYVIGYSSPAIPSLKEDGSIDDTSASWFGSLATLGAIFGCIIAGWLVDKYGRRFSLLCINVPFLFGWLAIVFANRGLFVGRFFTGVACGMVFVAVPTYMVEISSNNLRGMMGSGVMLSINTGIVLVYSLGLTLGWWGLALCAVFLSIISLVTTFLWCVESPRFFLLHGQKKLALKSLNSIRGHSGPEVDEELRDLEESVVNNNENSNIVELFTKRELLWPLIIVVFLMLFQQFTGINAILFYTAEIFDSGNFKQGDLATVAVGVLMVIGGFMACFLMDKVGRRILLLLSGLGIVLSLGFLGLFFWWTFNLASVGYEWMPVTTLASYIISFSIGWGPVPILVMSEFFPVKARGIATAIASVANWSFAFIVTKEFETLTGPLREHGVFWLFGGCTLVGLLFVWFFVPETKGKTLEDIELQFLKVSPLNRNI